MLNDACLNKQIRDTFFYKSKESLACCTKWFNGSLSSDGSLVRPLLVEWLTWSRTHSLDRVLSRATKELFMEGVSKKKESLWWLQELLHSSW